MLQSSAATQGEGKFVLWGGAKCAGEPCYVGGGGASLPAHVALGTQGESRLAGGTWSPAGGPGLTGGEGLFWPPAEAGARFRAGVDLGGLPLPGAAWGLWLADPQQALHA